MALLLGASALPDDPQQRVNEPKAQVFERARAEIAVKTEVFQHTVGREHFDWSVDLDEGQIRFTAPTYVASAPVQVIGTYNTLSVGLGSSIDP
nr:DUF6882 domain-containing protein [Sphingomonas pituitosa]